jgi:sugar phosphate isomerase/epimerase
MKLSFMTFLYPQLSSDAVMAKAKQFGYDGIEWRAEAGHKHGVELDAPAGVVKGIRARVADAGLLTSCLATSVKFCSPDKAERDANLERLYAYVDLAAEIGAPCIRFFGDPIPNTGRGARAESYAQQSPYMALAAARAAKSGVRLCLETHSVFRAFDAGEVLFRAGYPSALWINWHLEHCINNGEDVDEAYRHVKGRVTHAHFSMTRAGERDMTPYVAREMELLHAEGFQGFFSVELFFSDDAEADKAMAEQAAAWKAAYSRLSK